MFDFYFSLLATLDPKRIQVTELHTPVPVYAQQSPVGQASSSLPYVPEAMSLLALNLALLNSLLPWGTPSAYTV